MNALSLETLGAGPSAASRLMQLDPHERREVVRRAVEWGVERGVSEYVARHGMAGLGQQPAQDAVAAGVMRALQPILPGLQQALMSAVEPAAKKASEVVGPTIDEKLAKWGPLLGIMSGIVAAILGILGMVVIGGYVVRKVA